MKRDIKGVFHTKVTPGGIKDVDKKEGIVTGYASTFGNIDEVGDIMLPVAYNRTLANRGDRVKALWQHSAFDPVGKPVKKLADDHGLYTETKMSMTRVGQDALKLVEDEVITDMSVGFDILDFAWDENGHRLLRELKLYEYSFVTFPANEQANILGVKNLEGIEGIRQHMQRVEKSLSSGEWASDELPELLTLQLKTWRAALARTELPEDWYKGDLSHMHPDELRGWIDHASNHLASLGAGPMTQPDRTPARDALLAEVLAAIKTTRIDIAMKGT